MKQHTSRRRLTAAAALAAATAAAVTGTLLAAPAALAAPAPPAASSDEVLPDLAVTLEDVPSVLDFDSPGDIAYANWEFNRPAWVTLTLTHTASGKQRTISDYAAGTVWSFPLRANSDWWDGLAGYSGEYTWKMTAENEERTGPGVERTGTLTLDRPAKKRVFDSNGFEDVLVRDTAGQLSAYDANQLLFFGANKQLTPTVLSTEWSGYTLTTSTGDLGGTATDDVVGMDADGTLWLHQGEGQKFLPRTKVGTGWRIYNQLIGGSDLNADGRGDLLARDTSGVLWFYASTGHTDMPFKPRVKIGGGWQIYNQITATGDLAGATGGDLVARDAEGVLWLYLGKDDGTFTARRLVGGGWQQFTGLAPIGDMNGDGRVDLYAVGPSGGRYYASANSVNGPFQPATPLSHQLDALGSGTVF
ncbi:hypothetical protein [Streptomyces hydrogenans]|uniref:hypothetical protein n=1 Tax=Streptomyces hydrogenans TaxID=1873719 RepID=UPI00278C803F|nr:hypothetical protein [Streptomyces hydrogenans]